MIFFRNLSGKTSARSSELHYACPEERFEKKIIFVIFFRLSENFLDFEQKVFTGYSKLHLRIHRSFLRKKNILENFLNLQIFPTLSKAFSPRLLSCILGIQSNILGFYFFEKWTCSRRIDKSAEKKSSNWWNDFVFVIHFTT